jgi:hypothetical protein
MAQLSKEDDRVVRKWWKCSSGVIFENGRFILDNEYRPSASTNCCKLVGNGRSFQSILRSAGVGNIVRRSPFFWFFLFSGRVSQQVPFPTEMGLV